MSGTPTSAVGRPDAAEVDASGAFRAAGGDDSWRSVVGPRLLVAALVAWLWSLIGVDLREMTDVGLLSVLPFSFVLALALSTVGFLFVIDDSSDRRWLVAGYLVLLTAMAHATPALLYGTARSSFSYEHLGMVDYVQRTGALDPAAGVPQVHRAWPGVFAAAAALADVTGVAPETIAIWTPFALTLVALVALWVLFRHLVDDPQAIALGLWLFVVANWVGQEYFSPQGVGYALYLSVLAIAVPLERIRRRDPEQFEFLDGGHLAGTHGRRYVWSSAAVVVIVVAIVASHLVSAIMVVVTFTIVALFRAARTGWIAMEAAGLTIVWLSVPALTFVRDQSIGAAATSGLPIEVATGALVDGAQISSGQAFVVIAGRFLAQAMVVLAIIGLVVVSRRRRGSTLVAALLFAPIVLVFLDPGLEMLLRSYLYALPWIAVCAAVALITLTDGWSFAARLATRSVVVGMLVLTFAFAYLGSERSHHFTTEEVDLATWLYESAPEGSLFIEGSADYPGRLRNIERFAYVRITEQPDDTVRRIDADPAGSLSARIAAEAPAGAFVVLTRSMQVAQDAVPTVPEGMFVRIDAALRASDRFDVVFTNRDGTVWIASGDAP